MKIGLALVKLAINHPKAVTWVMVATTILLALLAVLPSVRPAAFPFLNPVKVDTDPENMLPPSEAVRVFHDRMKEEMNLHDMVVVGIVNEQDRQGVFNPGSLRKIYDLTKYAETLRWPDKKHPGRMGGVIEADLIAPSRVDNMEPGGPGVVKFEWLMPTPPATRAGALAIRHKAERIPFLRDTLVSGDGRALCLYLPLTSKDLSYRVYSRDLNSSVLIFLNDHVAGQHESDLSFGLKCFVG